MSLPREPASTPRRLVLVAGESSGDALGADLIERLREVRPELAVAGIGGPRMAAAGMECWFSADELAVMGLTEVLRDLPRLLETRRTVARRAQAWGAQGFVGIDAPDFNLGLARRLRRRGLRTVQYVCPSIWAWRRKRAARLGRCVDRVLCLFPFEPPLLEGYAVDAHFVGHPLADRIPLASQRARAREALRVREDSTVVALLPGSRRSEVARIGPELARAAALMARRRSELRFLVPAATAGTRERFEDCLTRFAPGVATRVVDGRATEVLAAADLAVIASGTATLEALLVGTSMIVVYRIAPSTHFLVHALGWMEVDQYSLPNALADGPLVTELMQTGFTAERVAEETLALLDDAGRREAQEARFAAIHSQLRRGAGARAAGSVLELLGWS